MNNNMTVDAPGDPFADDLDVVSRGVVRHMRVPAGWSWGDHRNSGSQLNSYQELFLRNNPEVTIWLFYRGTRISEQGTKLFHQILAGEDHLLSKSEIASIVEVLKDQSDPNIFDLLIAKKATINEHPVLIIEGRYKETQLDRYHIYLEADPHGRGGVIQEIFYQAPKADFFPHLGDAKNTFSSIQWR